jgi:tetratricopeptide (TPR) repeat protein
MNARLVTIPALALLLSTYASARQGQQEPLKDGQTATVLTDATAFKQELTRQISLQEITVRQLESAHAASVELSGAYERLGMLYQDGAQWERAEAALGQAIILLRSTSVRSEMLAAAISQLGAAHLLMGKLRESEKENQETLKIREALGNRLQIARTWNDLAALFLAQNKFQKVRSYAQKALDEFTSDSLATPFDKISARFAIARALCSTDQCTTAIPLLKTALEDAKNAPQVSNLPVGLGYFLLGYAYWRSGEMSLAGEDLERGTTMMNARLGWGHPVYVNALRLYVQFLHENHNVEAANVVERRVRQAEAVVDIHSIQAAQGMFGVNGLK